VGEVATSPYGNLHESHGNPIGMGSTNVVPWDAKDRGNSLTRTVA